MSTLPNGLDDNAVLAAGAWEIVIYANPRTAFFSERLREEVFAKLTNEYIRACQAIYHGKGMEEEKE